MRKIFSVILSAALFFSAPAGALSVRHEFAAGIGLFDAGTAEFEYTLQKKEYAVKSTVRTNGTFHFLYPFEAQYFTAGKIKGAHWETNSYRYQSQSRFSKRRKELVYDQNGQPVYSINIKDGKEKKKTIEKNAANKDTTNLQTVLVALAKHYNEMGFCDSKIPIFDGKRRYDVIFRDEGFDKLTAQDNFPFAGKAAKCSMYIDKLGAEGDDMLWQLTSDRPIYFWLLRDAQTGVPFVARIKINDTPLGEMNVYATKIEVKK